MFEEQKESQVQLFTCEIIAIQNDKIWLSACMVMQTIVCPVVWIINR